MSVIWHVPGFPDNEYDTRYGDTQFFKDGYRFLVIDGGEPKYAELLITDPYSLRSYQGSSNPHSSQDEGRIHLQHNQALLL